MTMGDSERNEVRALFEAVPGVGSAVLRGGGKLDLSRVQGLESQLLREKSHPG